MELYNKIAKVLETSKSLYLAKDSAGHFCYDIDASYEDVLSKETIHKILEQKNPLEALEEKVYSYFEDTELYMHCDIFHEVKEALPEEDEDELRETLQEMVYFNYPHDHFMGQSVCTTIMVDAGDGNYDFSLNTCEGGIVDEVSGVLWLAQQQGHTLEQLEAELQAEDHDEKTFLGSLAVEIEETHSHMNVVTFLTTMTLGQLIEIKDLLENPDQKFVISKKSECGLFDPFYGAGSMLEVKLDKDVEISAKNIFSFQPDGMDNYGVDEVYGVDSSLFEKGKVSIDPMLDEAKAS